MDMEIDTALRMFLATIRLPGEAQKIDRMVEAFAERYLENNPQSIFPNKDSAYIMAFAIVMLNTDAHNPNIKRKMTREAFIQNNSGICEGQDLPEEYLGMIYNRVIKDEIKMDSLRFSTPSEKSGFLLKQGGRFTNWKKRWFLLRDNCLYYYQEPGETAAPCGIIPLNNVGARPVPKKKFSFELYAMDKKTITSCKRKNGAQVQGHHETLLMQAESKADMESWLAVLDANIATGPVYKKLQAKKDKQVQQKTSSKDRPDKQLDWKKLHSIGVMNCACYKPAAAIMELYKNVIVGPPVGTGVRIQYFIAKKPSAKVQRVIFAGAFNIGNVESDIFKNFNVMALFGNDELNSIFDTLKKVLVTEYAVQIAGHSLGAIVALLLCPLLEKEGFKISDVITFGQPKFLNTEEERTVYQDFPVQRVVATSDPVPTLFPNCYQVGAEIVLMPDKMYSLSERPVVRHSSPDLFAQDAPNHAMTNYVKLLKPKLKASKRVNIAKQAQKSPLG
eukprot:TRINITY_DN19735_c0_g1_i1.p1 TRINITY_DN19735_c0_g1~~TRINITY_DN19735_c0_g1_i1.p1  ORF type:complete len:523 (+),score=91.87 TRINITY_DN19735_c0_g1_i1:61-1569(+)